MTGGPDDLVRHNVAERVQAMGHLVDADDIRVSWMDDDPAPGVRAFVARYRWSETRGALTGIVIDGSIDSRPAPAVAQVFARWRLAGGFPPAPRAAGVVAFLLGGAGPWAVINDESDIDTLVTQDEWKTHVSPPSLITEDGRPGVLFWWVHRTSLSQVEAVLGSDGNLVLQSRPIRDFPSGG